MAVYHRFYDSKCEGVDEIPFVGNTVGVAEKTVDERYREFIDEQQDGKIASK